MIVAIGANGEIGVKGGLPWHLPADLQYFKKTTFGCPVIMGRTTYFSLPFRPLKGRKNVVLNLGGDPIQGDVTCVNSFDEAYEAVQPCERCFIMGGASVYRRALPDMDRLYITHVHACIPDADAFFPAIDPSVWRMESLSDMQHDEESGYYFQFAVYTKR